MLDLSNITLVTIGTSNFKKTIEAINNCIRHAKFSHVYFLTNKENFISHDHISFIEIPALLSLEAYNRFRVLDFPDTFLPLLKTEHFLLIEWDGYIVNPHAWNKEFLNYDYIGAPFPITKICGNGGFTLRSKKFLQTQKQLCTKENYKQFPEDLYLSFVLRKAFTDKGCKFAPPELGYSFSTEDGDYKKNNSFGFHSFLLNPQFKNID